MTSLTQKASSAPQQEAFLLSRQHFFQKQDFKRLFNSALKKHGRFFILYYQKSSVQDVAMLGLVISKKYTRTSVKRNLIKRLGREHFRLAQHQLQGLQIMLMAKKGIAAADSIALRQDLEQLFSFLKKLNYDKNVEVKS